MPKEKPTFEAWMRTNGYRPNTQPDKDFTNYDGVYDRYRREVHGVEEITLGKVNRVLSKLLNSGK